MFNVPNFQETPSTSVLQGEINFDLYANLLFALHKTTICRLSFVYFFQYFNVSHKISINFSQYLPPISLV